MYKKFSEIPHWVFYVLQVMLHVIIMPVSTVERALLTPLSKMVSGVIVHRSLRERTVKVSL